MVVAQRNVLVNPVAPLVLFEHFRAVAHLSYELVHLRAFSRNFHELIHYPRMGTVEYLVSQKRVNARPLISLHTGLLFVLVLGAVNAASALTVVHGLRAEVPELLFVRTAVNDGALYVVLSPQVVDGTEALNSRHVYNLGPLFINLLTDKDSMVMLADIGAQSGLCDRNVCSHNFAAAAGVNVAITQSVFCWDIWQSEHAIVKFSYLAVSLVFFPPVHYLVQLDVRGN